MAENSELQEKRLTELLQELTPLELSILLRTYSESALEYLALHQKKINEIEEKRNIVLEVVESTINEKYSEDGLLVFWAIDGRSGVKEIKDRTGLSEENVVKILDYLKRRGIIRIGFLTKPTKRLDSIVTKIYAFYKNKELFDKFKLFVKAGGESAGSVGRTTSFAAD